MAGSVRSSSWQCFCVCDATGSLSRWLPKTSREVKDVQNGASGARQRKILALLTKCAVTQVREVDSRRVCPMTPRLESDPLFEHRLQCWLVPLAFHVSIVALVGEFNFWLRRRAVSAATRPHLLTHLPANSTAHSPSRFLQLPKIFESSKS